MYALIEALHLGHVPAGRRHELTPVLFTVAEAGDPVASGLVDRLADEVANMAAVALGRLGLLDSPAPVLLGGSILAARRPGLDAGVRGSWAGGRHWRRCGWWRLRLCWGRCCWGWTRWGRGWGLMSGCGGGLGEGRVLRAGRGLQLRGSWGCEEGARYANLARNAGVFEVGVSRGLGGVNPQVGESGPRTCGGGPATGNDARAGLMWSPHVRGWFLRHRRPNRHDHVVPALARNSGGPTTAPLVGGPPPVRPFSAQTAAEAASPRSVSVIGLTRMGTCPLPCQGRPVREGQGHAI